MREFGAAVSSGPRSPGAVSSGPGSPSAVSSSTGASRKTAPERRPPLRGRGLSLRQRRVEAAGHERADHLVPLAGAGLHPADRGRPFHPAAGVWPPATMTVTRPAPASPGSGCSPGPVTTYAAPGDPGPARPVPARQTCQAGRGRSCPSIAIQMRPARLVASAMRAGGGGGAGRGLAHVAQGPMGGGRPEESAGGISVPGAPAWRCRAAARGSWQPGGYVGSDAEPRGTGAGRGGEGARGGPAPVAAVRAAGEHDLS